MKDKGQKASISRRSFLGAGAAVVASSACSAIEPKQVPGRHWDMTADVVVMGSGAAGIAAAIDARRSGASVVVLEKYHRLGGSSGMSGGVCYMGGGTPLQKTHGFEDSVEDMYNYIVGAGSRHPHLDKIQLYCEESLNHFDWMYSNGVRYDGGFSAAKGVPMGLESLYYSGNEQVHPYHTMSKPAPRGHMISVRMDLGGRELLKVLTKSARDLGVKIIPAASCEQLIVASDGAVLGMQFSHEGSNKSIKANGGVVLAAGGFIHNRDMVKAHAPELYDCAVPWGNAGDLGEGIRMGVGVGGTTLRMNQGFAIMPLFQPEYPLKGIVVNQHGQRFTNEDNYHAFLGHDIAYKQDGVAFLLTDEVSSYKHDDYRLQVMATANTIAEIESEAGFSQGVLQQTVNFHNEHAINGSDPIFSKAKKYVSALNKPPFKLYDISSKNSFFVGHTFGGLETSIDAQVVHADGSFIPGLYAAGRTSSGLPSAPYIASGISIGDSLFFGRRAGSHAAARASGGAS